MSYAILIDGGFVRRKLGSKDSFVTVEVIQCLVNQIRSANPLACKDFYRVFFYDAKPLESKEQRPLNGGVEDFGASVLKEKITGLFDGLKVQPYFAMRFGEVSFNGWMLKASLLKKNIGTERLTITKDDLKPNVSQKGVDMRIGLDMASLTLKKIVDTIVLVTGDSDFVPSMKFVRREGAQIYLVPLKHRIKDSLIEHSDLVIDINPKDILNSSKKVSKKSKQN